MKLTPESYDESPKRRRTLSRVLIGPAKDLRDPKLFHSLSLVAFLGVVGLAIVFFRVFVTFTLSQLGMSALWWRERSREPRWLRKFLINGVGCVFTALIPAADLGFHAETRTGIGADVVIELRRLCLEVAEIFPQAVFFAGHLVFI